MPLKKLKFELECSDAVGELVEQMILPLQLQIQLIQQVCNIHKEHKVWKPLPIWQNVHFVPFTGKEITYPRGQKVEKWGQFPGLAILPPGDAAHPLNVHPFRPALSWAFIDLALSRTLN